MSKDTTKQLYYFSTFDGGLYVTGKCHHAKFIMNMLTKNQDYVLKAQQALTDAGVGSIVRPRPDYNTDGCTRQPQVRLESRVHPTLTKIWNRIYMDGRKVIDPHMLTLMDAEALSIIFMADGGRTVDKRCHATPMYRLHTKGFSYGDNFLLKKTLKQVFDLEWNIHRQNQYYYLYLHTKDSGRFETLVSPWVLPSFSYKLGR